MAAAAKGAIARRRPSLLVVAGFVLPAFALFAVFLLYPISTALFSSLFSWTGTTATAFVGLDNFVELFSREPFVSSIPAAFAHNLALFAGAMLLQNSIGIFIAVHLQRFGPTRRVLQVLYTTPYLVSPLVVGYLWSMLLSPTFGPVNAVLKAVGLDFLALPWLGDPTTALPVMVLIAAWQWIGFPVLLYGAALAGVAPEIDEAARVDGAEGFKRFFYVTGPLLVPVIGTVSVLTFIGSMEQFTLAYALGGATGSPAGATDVMGLLFFRTSFQSGAPNAMGLSSALAALLFLVILTGTLVGRGLLRRYETRLL